MCKFPITSIIIRKEVGVVNKKIVGVKSGKLEAGKFDKNWLQCRWHSVNDDKLMKLFKQIE